MNLTPKNIRIICRCIFTKSIYSLSDYLKKDLDIIIDDASHNLKDILTAFGILFKKLKSGGCYVIEDIDQFKVLKELNPYSGEPTPLDILKKINKKQDFKTSFIDDESKKYLIKNIKDIKIEKGFMKINGINVGSNKIRIWKVKEKAG